MKSSWRIKRVVASAALMVLVAMAAFGAGRAEATQETWELDAANVLTSAHTHSQAVAHFATRVNELTDGRVTINVYNDGVLGDERVVMEQLQLGATAFTRTSHAVLTGVVPEMNVFGLPYLFDSVTHMHEVLEGDLGDFLSEKLAEEGLIILGWFDYGARSVIAKEPVRTPADLAGKRIRVQQSPLDVASFEAFGASAVPLPWPDQYPALDSGVIDATENAPDTIYDGRFHEVARYYSLTEHFIQPTPLYASAAVMEGLPQDIQNAIIQAGRDAVAFIKENQPIAIDRGLENLQNEGATIVRDVDKDAFREAAAPVWERFLSDYPALRPFIEQIQQDR